eukprot:Gregarina_sp_Poly_1__1810@NODE_146_length_12814_cov_124_771633_g131_i0_p4_GENE_NODE_146_length_12814_cov_124_771633_g131_i0NODE_146_length_12814_cov_124_771633_g131_i0_p4_ORF_typecomplete_len532_score57_22Gly_kinase/PF02595_15/5_1e93_NODE_146_length_12814_cov_124_771633_g131_i0901685
MIINGQTRAGYQHVSSEGGSLTRTRFRFGRRIHPTTDQLIGPDSIHRSRSYVSPQSSRPASRLRSLMTEPQSGEAPDGAKAMPQNLDSQNSVAQVGPQSSFRQPSFRQSSLQQQSKATRPQRATSAEPGCLNRWFNPCFGGKKSASYDNLSVIIAMGAFKGTMSSRRAAFVTEAALKAAGVENIYIQVVSDGGDGFLDAFSCLYGKEAEILHVDNVHGASFEVLPSVPFLFRRKEKIAIIESSLVVGYNLLSSPRRPQNFTSFGVGEMILAALELHAETIYLGVGSTSTIDGGAGMAQALGAKFFNEDGAEIPADCNVIFHAKAVDLAGVDRRLAEVRVVAAVDVDNVLLGEDGAVAVFGPQKGVVGDGIRIFEQQIMIFSILMGGATNRHSSLSPGSGAGGGLGFMCASLLGAELHSGFDLLTESSQLQARVHSADLVLTGEESFDRQSLHGKIPVKIARMAKAYNTKVFLFAGKVEGDIFELPEEGITCVVPLTDKEDAEPDQDVAEVNLSRAVLRSVTLARAGKFITI